MRDFLEDAHSHRDDGYGRVQTADRQALPKRFYKATGVEVVEGGFSVTLDGRQTKTPGQKKVIVPVSALATAMAAEWAGQGEFIDPSTMPLIRLVNAAVEGGEQSASTLRAEIIKYAGNDLLLYRADTPQELVAEQERAWDGALIKIARHFGVGFQPTIGILHQPQPQVTLDKLAEALEGEGHFVLAALVAITSITGSGLLAIAYWHKLLSPEDVWAAAHVDENHNQRLWGEVDEAKARRAQRRNEFDAAVGMLEMLRP